MILATSRDKNKTIRTEMLYIFGKIDLVPAIELTPDPMSNKEEIGSKYLFLKPFTEGGRLPPSGNIPARTLRKKYLPGK
jgi:hypothetical protein